MHLVNQYMTQASHPAVTDLHTILDFWRWGQSQFDAAELFFGHGVDNASDEMRWLLCAALNLPFDFPNEFLACNLVRDEKEHLLALVDERIKSRKPLAYLLGEAWFAGMKFKVTEDTLVPRSPIAELIEQGFGAWRHPEEYQRVLDLCTGSGCIGIATAEVLPHTSVVLSDISEAALAVARENVAAHGLEERVEVVQSDLFENIEGQFDLIVSNPPYVTTADYNDSPDEYKREPKLGLEAGEHGLDLVIPMLQQAANYLTEEGWFICEVGESWPQMQAWAGDLPLEWIEFQSGGYGVFAISAAELRAAFADVN